MNNQITGLEREPDEAREALAKITTDRDTAQAEANIYRRSAISWMDECRKWSRENVLLKEQLATAQAECERLTRQAAESLDGFNVLDASYHRVKTERDEARAALAAILKADADDFTEIGWVAVREQARRVLEGKK